MSSLDYSQPDVNGSDSLTNITDITVEFHDVDSLNIVWHGHYVRYFEVARCRLLESIGYGYDVMKATGHMWPVVDVRVKFVRPAHFRQIIRIKSQLVEWENRIKVIYQLTCATTGEVLTKGYTTQMAVDMNTNETLFESPKTLLDLIQAAKKNEKST